MRGEMYMKITVYITSYNQKELLKQAIESVLNQTLQPFEIIIVDDASVDGSVDLIKMYAQRYPNLIRYILNEENIGVSKVRVAALESVCGDYVTYLDGDDLYLPQKLEKEASLICEGDYDVAFSNTAYFRNHPLNIEHIWASDLRKMPKPGNMYLETFCRFFPRNSLFRMELVRYDLLKEIGFHDRALELYEDYELRIRLSQKARIAYTLEPLALVRLNHNGLSSLPNNRHLKALDYIYNKHLDAVLLQFPKQKAQIRHRTDQFRERPLSGFLWHLLSKLKIFSFSRWLYLLIA